MTIQSPQIHIKSQGRSSKTPNIVYSSLQISDFPSDSYAAAAVATEVTEATEGLFPIFTQSAAVLECLRDIRDSCHETCDAVCAVRHTAAVLQPALLHRPSWTRF